jgi:magnesium transporter
MAIPQGAVWIDLLQPTREEELIVEGALGLDVPTREEIREIEASSRLYRKGGALFMTTVVISNADTPRPETTEITFILAGTRLITLRYAGVQPFSNYVASQQRGEQPTLRGEQVLLGLLDAIVDRVADILERTGGDLDAVSHEIFHGDAARAGKRGNRHHALRRIGRNGDMTSKASESLVSLARLLTFLGQADENSRRAEANGLLEVLDRDIKSLASHANFLSEKANFLLSATLGLVNIEQTDIIKIFSVAAVMFLPPTLVASVYGMNFKFMPELNWPIGYPCAILLMIASAVLPYCFFKRRGWL